MLTGISPDSADGAVAVQVSIAGDNLAVGGRVDLDHPSSSPGTEPSVSLSGNGTSVPLEQAMVVSANLITAVVPAGLAPGAYELDLVDAWGRPASLANAFTVTLVDAGTCVDGAACKIASADGLCKEGACVPCTEPSDDAACTGAYETPSLCLRGSCAPGDCRTDANCNGDICGLNTTNFCGKCTTDAQCRADPGFGAGTLCQISTGACVPATCSQVGHACPANPNDICCGTDAGAACIAGMCCTNGDCDGGYTCQSHACIPPTCVPVLNATYYVDPTAGSDSSGNGSPPCPFRSVTRALASLAASGMPALIDVLPGTLSSPPEAFPILVPPNVRIQGASSPPVVQVPPNDVGFQLVGADAGLSNLVVEGSQAAATGIDVVPPADLSTTVDHVTVQDMMGDGISVRDGTMGAGAVRLGPGTASNANAGNGLKVFGSGFAAVFGGSNADQTAFNGNTGSGILVQDTAAVAVHGTTPSMDAGAVVANGNVGSGLSVEQREGAGAPAVQVTGISIGLSQTAGVSLRGGSNVLLRGAIIEGNLGPGVLVLTSLDGMSNDLTGIDLGTDPAASPGRNILQSSGPGAKNHGAGICLSIPPGAGQTLQAAGNLFSGPGGFTDCALPDAGTLSRGGNCSPPSDLSLPGSNNMNAVNAANCN